MFTIKKKYAALLIIFLFITGFCGYRFFSANRVNHVKLQSVPAYDIQRIIRNLPGGQTWLDHLEYQLMPFWTMKTAIGSSPGDFPTYRCNDGQLPDPNTLCPEYRAALADPDLRGLIKLDRQYTRSQSRQSYAYGMAYHLTGDEKYLRLMKDGVDFMRAKMIDRVHGGVCSYLLKPGNSQEPPPRQRTSQDMAYALTGMGFYYYLTHDETVLADILSIKNYIFNTYFDKELGLLKWVLDPSPDGDNPKQKELVSQLDQIYAYMLWLTPSLPEPCQTQWKQELHQLARIIINQFYSQKYGFFWGAVTNPLIEKIGTNHTDFGHSVKTFWLIYLIGKMTDDTAMVNLAREKAVRILDYAYDKRNKSWARRFDERGKPDENREWWIMAELDQTTATLSLIDPSYARYLVGTYNYWLRYMVDCRKNSAGNIIGGVWPMVDGRTNQRILKYPKQHSWTGLHEFEHALISYMTTQELKEKPFRLFYAFKNKSDCQFIHPYFFEGKVNKIRTNSFQRLKTLKRYEVFLSDLH
jgi:mannose/cellobiose epimerase-like protein (N-acyl-D-glucosamine 2-epimerase family)